MSYLSKNEAGLYCIILNNGLPLNAYTSKEQCRTVADVHNINISGKIWSAKELDWIKEV